MSEQMSKKLGKCRKVRTRIWSWRSGEIKTSYVVPLRSAAVPLQYGICPPAITKNVQDLCGGGPIPGYRVGYLAHKEPQTPSRTTA